MDKKVLLKKIGLKIRELREENNLSIQDFADKLDMEYNNVIRIEKGRTNPTVVTLFKISRTLGVRLIAILDVE